MNQPNIVFIHTDQQHHLAILSSPRIIWQAHCVHRGGYEIEFLPGDGTNWQKIYDPAFVYLNTGGDYDTLWQDVKG